MKQKITLFTAFVSLFFFASGQSGADFPYKNGEKQLGSDFLEYYAHNKKNIITGCEGLTNDSAGIYIVQLQYSHQKKKIQADIFGTNNANDLTNVVRGFFNQSIDKWDKNFLKKNRVIVPVIILNTCPMQAGSVWIDWLQFARNYKIVSGNCFFVSPIYQQFFYTPPDKETGMNN